MINHESEGHPYYEMTEKIREIYPKESRIWEKLLNDLKDPKNRGCYTCKFYHPSANEFCDIESADDDIDDDWLPWDTEEAYVDCDKNFMEQTALKIKCPLWESYIP
ncbi:MAG: hypothetical protein KAT28_05295 [Candidatus Aenigmarchaeota archaeon]|nr:hypothetical protein [Candidatus Aenigmarchaeota archaeon]